MKEKILSLLLALLLLLSLSACGGGATEDNPPQRSTVEEAAPTVQQEPVALPEVPGAEVVDVQEQPADQDTAAPTQSSLPVSDGPSGVYKLSSITEDGKTEDLAMLESLGLSAYLILSEDGTGMMDSFGEARDLRWDENSLLEVGEEPLSYTFNDGVLTCTGDGLEMVFTKLSEEELAKYEAEGSLDPNSFFGKLTTSDIPEGKVSTAPVSGTLDGNAVTILRAERFEEDGDAFIRFYYDFTNGTDEETSAFMELFFEAGQDGKVLEAYAGLDNEVPEDGNDMEDIAPGETIRCTEIYSCKPDGGTIGFRISGYEDDVLLYYAEP